MSDEKSAQKEPDPNTLHGKFILAKRSLLGDIQLSDIQRLVNVASHVADPAAYAAHVAGLPGGKTGWETPDGATLQRAYATLSIPLHKLAESVDDKESFDQCVESLNSLNKTLREFVGKYKDVVLPEPVPIQQRDTEV
jgi:hypothetical protein